MDFERCMKIHTVYFKVVLLQEGVETVQREYSLQNQ